MRMPIMSYWQARLTGGKEAPVAQTETAYSKTRRGGREMCGVEQMENRYQKGRKMGKTKVGNTDFHVDL